MDLISIIVPVYNAEKYLCKCVDSLLGQTYPNTEILLIDDCSKDRSAKICREYEKKHENIRFVQNEKNSGVSAARNHGLSSMKGACVCFVDSDDWVEPNFCEALYRALKNSGADTAVCGCFYENVFEKKPPEIHVWNDKKDAEKTSLREGFDMYGCWVLNTLWNKIFKTEIIRKNHLCFDRNRSMGEDLKFVLEYLHASGQEYVYVLSEPLYHYMRYSGETLMGSFGQSSYYDGLENLVLLKKIVEKYNKEANTLFEQKKYALQNNYIYFAARDKNTDKKTKLEKIKQIRPEITPKEIKAFLRGARKEKLYNWMKRR